MSETDRLIALANELFGYEFQEAFTIALKAVVLRRRQGCNEVQQLYWMAVATEDQKREAHNDACEIIKLGLHLE